MAGLSGGHGWQPDDEIIAHVSDSFQGHVSAALNRPFVVLFEQKGADETAYGLLVGEDANHISASLDLAVEAFDRICAVKLGSMFLGEAHVGQDVVFGLVHDGSEFGHLGADLIGNGAPLSAGGLRRFLGEGGANEGRETTRRPLLPAWASALR